MTQLCESDAIASSSAAAAEAASQVGGGGVPGLMDDMYFMRHILDMKPSSDDDSSNFEIHTSPNSPPTPQRTKSRLLGQQRQSMPGPIPAHFNVHQGPHHQHQQQQQQPHHQLQQQQQHQQQQPHQHHNQYQPHQYSSPFSSPPISTSPNGFPLYHHHGMKDVPLWLKTLRLHKYTTMFQNLSYDEMMNLNERQLEHLKVTKGARKKILQSLEKLRERVAMLKTQDRILDEKSDLTYLISEIRQIMNTPICSYKPKENEMSDIDGVDACTAEKISDQNLPGHIIHLLSRIHEILFEYGKCCDLEDEYLLKLLQIYEKIFTHDSFTSRQRAMAGHWKRQLRKTAVEKNLLPPGNGHNNIGIGYAGFKRASFTQHRMSSTRSSTTSPPESSCAISPPPMPPSFSAPPLHSSPSSSAIVPKPSLPFERLCEHPQGAALLKQLVELSLQLQSKEDQEAENLRNTVPHHRYGGTQTPPGSSKERISISKSLSSPDNSRLRKPLSQEEKSAFMNQCRNENRHTNALPPTPPNWMPMEASTSSGSSRYHSRVPPPHPGMTHHSSMPTSQWTYHQQQQQHQPQHQHNNNNNNNNNNIHASTLPYPSMAHHPSTLDAARRTCFPSYTGRQSLSARMPSSTSSGFSSGGSDRSSGAGSPTTLSSNSSSAIPFFPSKWSSPPSSSSSHHHNHHHHHPHHQGSYNVEMCNSQNMPPVK